MRIISWNINGFRAAHKKGLREKLDAFDCDIIGFQETKAQDFQLEPLLKDFSSYHVYLSSAQRPGYSGVALFSREKPLEVITSLNNEDFDREGRFLLARYRDFCVVNAYFPNGAGKDGDNSRVPYKLAFYDALFDVVKDLDLPQIIMGDFNTAHQEIDIARPKENKNTSGFLPIERQHFDKTLARGYIDTFRHFNKEPGHYSWWSMRQRARERNVGWRLDYVLVNQQGLPNVKSAFIWNQVLGSDHCPVGIDFI